MRTYATLFVSAIGAISAGCRAPASNLPPADVLHFGLSYLGGSVSFVAHADGTAAYDASGGRDPEAHVRAAVTPDELRGLTKVLRDNDFCGLRSHRSVGVPDEARPSISVRMEGLDCKVQLWDNEFSDDPRARACLAAVEGLAGAVRSRGK